MLNETIQQFNTLTIIHKDKRVDALSLKNDFAKLIESSYFAPSLIIASNELIENIIQKDFWLELKFETRLNFKNFTFEKLLIPIKPKCNWLTLYRINENNVEQKCLNLNLSTKTTDFYKKVVELLK